VLVAGQPQAAVDRKAEVEAMMSEALAHYGAVGREQSATDFANKSGAYFKGDLYVVIHGIDGSMVAHPVVPQLNGRDQLGLKDTDGKEFVKELVSVAQAGGGWVEYKWSNPETKKIAPKVAHVMPTGDGNFLIIGYYE
jgi:cytochrome c